MADGNDTPPFDLLTGPAPDASAPYEERLTYSIALVLHYLAKTGGDPDLPGIPAGHRYRTELSLCVEDPRRYKDWVDTELGYLIGS